MGRSLSPEQSLGVVVGTWWPGSVSPPGVISLTDGDLLGPCCLFLLLLCGQLHAVAPELFGGLVGSVLWDQQAWWGTALPFISWVDSGESLNLPEPQSPRHRGGLPAPPREIL